MREFIFTAFHKLADNKDPFVLNWILEMLEPLSRSGPKDIKDDAKFLHEKLNNQFELRLYHFLFGKKDWNPTTDESGEIVRQSCDSFHKILT